MTLSNPDLDDRLRSLGDELDRLSLARHTGQDASSQPSRLPLVAAGILAVVTVVGLVALAGRDANTTELTPSAITPQPDVTDASTSSVEGSTPVSASTVPGLEACWRSLDQMSGTNSAEGEVPGIDWPDRDASEVLVFDVPNDPSQVRVLIVDGAAGFTCKFDRAATAQATVQGEYLDTTGGADTSEPDSDEIQVRSVTSSAMGTEVGPGSTLYVGRAGSDVASIAVVVPDGVRHEGVVDSGWFVIDVDVPEGVELTTSHELSWATADGTEHQAPTSSKQGDDVTVITSASSLRASSALDFQLSGVSPGNPSVFGFAFLAPINVEDALAVVGSVLGQPDHDTGWQPMPESLSCTGAIEYRSILWDDLRFVVQGIDTTGDGVVDESVLAAWSIGDAPLGFSPPLDATINAASGVTNAMGLGLGSAKSSVLAEPFVQIEDDGEKLFGLAQGGTPVVFRLADERVISISIEQNDC